MDIESTTGTMTWTAMMAAAQLQQRRVLMIPWWQKILSLSLLTSSSFTVGENRPLLDALGRILSRRDTPSLDAKCCREARITVGETRRRVDEHWERQSQSRSRRRRLCTEEEEEDERNEDEDEGRVGIAALPRSKEHHRSGRRHLTDRVGIVAPTRPK